MTHSEGRAEVLARKERIEQLKARAEALCKGTFTSFACNDCPLEIQEQFWRRVVAIEESGLTTLGDILKQRGFVLTPAEQLSEEQVTERLWALIEELSEVRCFLSHTDHLSDRELYTQLLGKTLRDEVEEAMIGSDPASSYHYDLIGEGTDEDIQIMLRYYSEKEEREQWHDDFPDDAIPPMSIPPYDRDRLLPKWDER